MCSTYLTGFFLFGAVLCAQREPLGEWPRGTPAEFRMKEERLDRARDYALKGGGSGVVIHRGRLVYSWGDQKQRYDLKSSTKSIGATLLGLAIMDAKVKLHDPLVNHCPDVLEPPARAVTFFQLASQTAGFDKPGGFQPLLFQPGARWSYSDSGPNYLADCLTTIYKRDLQDLMFERVFTPLGITREDLVWRDNMYRPKMLHGVARREFGSGVHANVNAMARIGTLYARAGRIRSRQVLPPDFVALLRQPLKQLAGLPVLKEDTYPGAAGHYGLLWWNNGDGHIAGLPRDAYWSWGLFDSYIFVVPSLDLVVARAGGEHVGGVRSSSREVGFFRPLAEAVDIQSAHVNPPYPPSPVIASIEWAAPETIHRTGSDCDNFPSAWAADDILYTAHGDCRGFEPLRDRKLGLGFAKITGEPLAAKGTNIPAPNADNTGIGAEGKKASGMLAVDNVLYLWTRNAGNSQLAWSLDGARTWTWAPWKFTTSFGHPAFLNYGRNYAGARDAYVYIYSPDHESAYVNSPRLVMARVHKKNTFESRMHTSSSPASMAQGSRAGRKTSHNARLCSPTRPRACIAHRSVTTPD